MSNIEQPWLPFEEKKDSTAEEEKIGRAKISKALKDALEKNNKGKETPTSISERAREIQEWEKRHEEQKQEDNYYPRG
jgi:hypothetical protein